MTDRKIDPLRGLVPFAIIVTGLSGLLFFYLYLGRQPVPEVHDLQSEMAEGLGTVGLWALVVIYGRSLIKITLNEGTLMQRFIPNEYYNRSQSVSRKFLATLNRTHKYVGAVAIVVFACHALLMGTLRWNLFLEMVLVLLAWQGIFGIFLVMRVPVAAMKRYGYLVHAQLFTGVMIGVFAVFGHLLT
jgi:hypothetical protein